MEKIKKLFNELGSEVLSKRFIEVYNRIRQKYPSLNSYLSPADLSRCLHNQNNPDYILNDRILSDLIREYQSQVDTELVGAYLLVLFRPGLLKTFFQFKSRLMQFPSMNDLDLWLQIATLFFEEINNFNFDKDNSKIASKILIRIKNRLRDYFKDLLKSITAEHDLGANPALGFLIPVQLEPHEITILLQDLVDKGVISDTDKHIFLATKLYDRSMKDLSQKLGGLSYEAIRQRKARAQRAIFAYLKRKRKIS